MGTKGGKWSGSTYMRYPESSGLQRDSRSVVPGAGGEEGMGSYCSRRAEFQFGEMNVL